MITKISTNFIQRIIFKSGSKVSKIESKLPFNSCTRPFLHDAEWEKFKKSSWHIAFLPSEYRFDICVHVFLCIKNPPCLCSCCGFVAFRVSCHHTLLELQETPKTKGGLAPKKPWVLYTIMKVFYEGSSNWG